MSGPFPAKATVRIANQGDLASLAALFDAYRQFYAQPADRPQAEAFIGERLRRGDSLILVADADVTVGKADEADGKRGPEIGDHQGLRDQDGGDRRSHLIAFCQLYPSFCSVLAQPIFTLYDLYVAPTARGRGTGRQLLRAAHAQAAERQAARLDLTTARSNSAAQALYVSEGWVRDEVFLAYAKVITPGAQS